MIRGLGFHVASWASPWLSRGFLEASSRLPRSFLDASSRLPRSFLEASLRLPRGFLEASSRLPRRFLEASSSLPRPSLRADTMLADFRPAGQWLVTLATLVLLVRPPRLALATVVPGRWALFSFREPLLHGLHCRELPGNGLYIRYRLRARRILSCARF